MPKATAWASLAATPDVIPRILQHPLGAHPNQRLIVEDKNTAGGHTFCSVSASVINKGWAVKFPKLPSPIAARPSALLPRQGLLTETLGIRQAAMDISLGPATWDLLDVLAYLPSRVP